MTKLGQWEFKCILIHIYFQYIAFPTEHYREILWGLAFTWIHVTTWKCKIKPE